MFLIKNAIHYPGVDRPIHYCKELILIYAFILIYGILVFILIYICITIVVMIKFL